MNDDSNSKSNSGDVSLFLADGLAAGADESDVVVIDATALAALGSGDLIADFAGDLLDLDVLLEALPAGAPQASDAVAQQQGSISAEEIIAGSFIMPGAIAILYSDDEGLDDGAI